MNLYTNKSLRKLLRASKAELILSNTIPSLLSDITHSITCNVTSTQSEFHISYTDYTLMEFNMVIFHDGTDILGVLKLDNKESFKTKDYTLKINYNIINLDSNNLKLFVLEPYEARGSFVPYEGNRETIELIESYSSGNLLQDKDEVIYETPFSTITFSTPITNIVVLKINERDTGLYVDTKDSKYLFDFISGKRYSPKEMDGYIKVDDILGSFITLNGKTYDYSRMNNELSIGDSKIAVSQLNACDTHIIKSKNPFNRYVSNFHRYLYNQGIYEYELNYVFEDYNGKLYFEIKINNEVKIYKLDNSTYLESPISVPSSFKMTNKNYKVNKNTIYYG